MLNSDTLIYHGIVNVLFCTYFIYRCGIKSLSSFLSILYLITAICSYLYSLDPSFQYSYSNQPITTESLMFFNLANFLFIFPFRNFNIDNVSIISKINFVKIRRVLNALVVVNLLFFLLDFIEIFNGLFSVDIKALRDSTYGEYIAPWWSNPFFGVLRRLTTACEPIFLFFSIFGFVFAKNKTVYKYYFLIYLLSIVRIVGLVGSRAIIVFTILDLLILFILFQALLNKPIKKRIVKASFVVFILIAVFFSSITIARFSDSALTSKASEAIQSSTLLYMGESGINFMGSMYDKENNLLLGYDAFPLFRRVLGLEYFGVDRMKDTEYIEKATNTRAFIFYQLSGNIYSNFGKLGTILILILFNIFFKTITFSKRNISFISFLAIFFCASIVAKGIFYNTLITEAGNLSIVLVIMLYLFFQNEKNRINLNINYKSNFKSK